MSVLLTSDPWIATDDFNPTLNVAAALVGGGLSLLLAIKYAYDILSIEIRNKEDYEMTLSTAKKIADGAEQFLHSEYKILSIFVAAVTIILCAAVSWQSGMCFIVGAFLSATAGYVGMKIAVISNVRTTLTCSYTDDAKDGDDDMTKAFRRLNNGLNVAFKSGAVMSMGVVSAGLLGLSGMYLLFSLEDSTDEELWERLSGFAFGASSIALFARVGGGIYTKAADVGADLVGKVEEDLDEDSVDNPATIADNVGDNVGDVAGMGADLFESFVGSIIAACTLGYKDYGHAGVAFPFWIAGLGALCSIAGTFLIRASAPTTNESEKKLFKNGAALADEEQSFSADETVSLVNTASSIWAEEDAKELARIAEMQDGSMDQRVALSNLIDLRVNTLILESLLGSIRFSIYMSSFFVVCTSLISVFICFGTESRVGWQLFGCVLIGLLCGNLIGYFTEYFTSYTYTPTISIAEKSDTGPATVIIQGLGIGMISCVPPVIFIVMSTLGAYYFAGVYGIAIAAVGMLSTLGVTLATDAYGPVADNAGGIAEMCESEIDHSTREITDALDALGNTTAATGKGFAIGSAVLTALALMQAFAEAVELKTVDLLDPVVLPGVFIGALLPFVFAALTMLSVGKAAESIIWECRKQMNEKELEGKPIDHSECVRISTLSSLKEMVVPGCLAVFIPMVVGTILGARGLLGLLTGAISAGFLLAVTMANAGGAWDNAKKFTEKGGLGAGKGKKSENHKATVVGDTVGDPFKDTSGPALNILIKLMSIVSLVMAPTLEQEPWDQVWIGAVIAGALLIFCLVFVWYTEKFAQLHDYAKIEADSKIRKSGNYATPAYDNESKTNEVKGDDIELSVRQ